MPSIKKTKKFKTLKKSYEGFNLVIVGEDTCKYMLETEWSQLRLLADTIDRK